jgi:plastocyanin
MPNARLFASIASLFALAACGGGGGGSPTAPPGNNPTNPPVTSSSVTVGVQSFTPANITVTPGTTVTWNWNSCSSDGYGGPETCVAHTVTFDDGVGSTTKSSGTYTRQFAAGGEFPYHCTLHATMNGKVTVQ